jgi:hypothetical protein
MKRDGVKKPKMDEHKKHHCPAYMQNDNSESVENVTSHKSSHK